jgi:hypothetical protein
MEPVQIQIKSNDEELKGRFSNTAQIHHQPEHFFIDFFLISPPHGQLVSRIITTPGHMKAIAEAINTQLKEYEKNFGTVKPEKLNQKFGFNAD